MLDSDGLKQQLTVARTPVTLRTQALDKLRQAIIDGHLPPGMRLVERKLCDLLGVSRTLVREALRQLEAEGWIQNPPYRGPTVSMVGADDARQLYEVRASLEGLAARLCSERAGVRDRTDLVEAFDAVERAATEGDLAGHVSAVDGFYQVILRAAGNELLAATLNAQRSRLAWLRTLSLSQPSRGPASLGEKRAMMLAILARDGAAAQAAAEFHVRQAAKVAMQADRGDPVPPE